MLYRHRYYHPVLGTFCSRDPIGFQGSEWNFYEYVGGRPVVAIDTSGNSPVVSDLGAVGPSCVVHMYRSATQNSHVGIWVHYIGNYGGTAVNGTDKNGCVTTGSSGPPPKTSIIYTYKELDNSTCSCLKNSCSDWNATPSDQRVRTWPGVFPRNSNWVLKCIFKSCGVARGGPKPYGWDSTSSKCLKWRDRYIPDGCNPPRRSPYCAEYQECPDGFNVLGQRL